MSGQGPNRHLSETEIDRRLAGLKLISFDVDGVLTDGTVYFAETGVVSRGFNVKDGLGLQRLQDEGLVVAIISAGTTASITERFQRLGLRHIYIGVPDKLNVLKDLAIQAKATLEQAAHMGDDLNDLKLLEACGLGLAPMDAVAEVREAAHWLVPVPGGRGAARAVSDRIIKARRAAGLTAGEMGRHLEA